MYPESESQYNPENRGTEERPKWTVLTKTRFPEGSLGFSLFPDELESRSRPETIFKEEINESVLLDRASLVLKRLTQNDIKTEDILNLPETDLDSITVRKDMQRKIKEGLLKFLESLAITPHGRLIGMLYNRPQYPVPIGREKELIDVVEEKVNALQERDREILIYGFGLYDGITKSYRKTARHFSLGHSNVRIIENVGRIEERARRNISLSLRPYCSLPEESFARQLFGAVFYKDLPENLAVRLDLSRLSPPTKEELTKIYPYLRYYANIYPSITVDIRDIWDIDLQKASVPKEASEEILGHIRGLMVEKKAE